MHQNMSFGWARAGGPARIGPDAILHEHPPLRSGLFALFLTRLFLATVAFFGVWKLVDLGILPVFGRGPSGILDTVIATLAALLSMVIVGGIIERRSLAELGFGVRNSLRELGLDLLCCVFRELYRHCRFRSCFIPPSR